MKTEKEFNLSDCFVGLKGVEPPTRCYLEEDVKEFIRRLKEELLERFNIDEGDLSFLNELAGEDLMKIKC